MTEVENFIRARDNETDDRYLGTGWVRFRDFDVVEKTEDNVRVCAKSRDPGLPRYRKLPDGSEERSYSAEWLSTALCDDIDPPRGPRRMISL
jgi:hypothetical protein